MATPRLRSINNGWPRRKFPPEVWVRPSEILTQAQPCGSEQDTSPPGVSGFLSGVAATPNPGDACGHYM